MCIYIWNTYVLYAYIGLTEYMRVYIWNPYVLYAYVRLCAGRGGHSVGGQLPEANSPECIRPVLLLDGGGRGVLKGWVAMRFRGAPWLGCPTRLIQSYAHLCFPKLNVGPTNSG